MVPGQLAYLRGIVAAGTGEVDVVRDAATTVARLQPEASGTSLVLLALVGDPGQARALAASLAKGSTAEQEVAALEAWRRGERAAATAALALLEQRDPWPDSTVAPAYLLAELTADGGDPSEVVAAVERFHRMWPRGLWRGWAWSRSLLLKARALERLGQFDEARASADRLLGVLRRADSDSRIVTEARALRERLGRRGPAGSPGVPPPRPAP